MYFFAAFYKAFVILFPSELVFKKKYKYIWSQLIHVRKILKRIILPQICYFLRRKKDYSSIEISFNIIYKGLLMVARRHVYEC